MRQPNKYGLKDYIPEDVKREVRQRSGFGCVNCGSAFCEYHHFNPEFSEAREHKASGIALLCGTCHSRRSKGVLSEESLAKRYEHPKCLEDGFAHGALDIGSDNFAFVIGTLKVNGVSKILRFHGESILAIKPPEQEGAPFRVDARLFDKNGRQILWINDNISDSGWFVSPESWDVKVEGQRVTIRQAKGEINLTLRTEPPKQIVIERLLMFHRGAKIECKEGNHLCVVTDNNQTFQCESGEFTGCDVAIDIDEHGIHTGRNHLTAELQNVTFNSRRSNC